MTNFIITPEAIISAELIIQLEDPDCGAIATFSGTVRRHNFNRQVIRLHYQSYKTLAVKEGNKILGEAKKQFNIINALCVHRVGDLNIGEIAVWIGVNAGHRDAAFDACRYVIDEIKTRVPIWKKEIYVDGDSGWLEGAG
jgi:molybdopterin synthase catalytic subunit|tara:strand:- start:666 stop:1085 length:420 start_codon:yes stop_codon:yes gene_type:complete